MQEKESSKECQTATGLSEKTVTTKKTEMVSLWRQNINGGLLR
jgi:hypothetical protein